MSGQIRCSDCGRLEPLERFVEHACPPVDSLTLDELSSRTYDAIEGPMFNASAVERILFNRRKQWENER